jgi:predicted AAA+ superfamily ATPase
MMIPREAAGSLKKMAKEFRAVAIVGPRQSGKSTLAKMVFPDKPYVSFETPSVRNFFLSDPHGFLNTYLDGAVFDEAQRVPELFSYLQEVIDVSSKRGRFILTGSNNFALQEGITQTLAGRLGYIDLLPFSINEIQSQKKNFYRHDVHQFMFRGGYPEIATGKTNIDQWFASYVRTYIERDVRQLKSIENLAAFEKLLLLCAGRVGQLLNMSNLSIEAGINVNTVISWLGLLQSSYIIYLLKPHHNNFNKRVVRTPKLYFYDTGLASHLLGIHKAEELRFHIHRGALFENMVVNEMLKCRFNNGKKNNLFFWRDNTGNEIDVIIDNGKQLIPVEIKSGATITENILKGIHFWQKLTGNKKGVLVYGGTQSQHRTGGIDITGWETIGDL